MSKNLNLIEASKEFSVQAGDVTISNVTLDDTVSLDSNVDISANIKSTLNASGDAPIYACRAWVNFDGTFGTSPFTEANGGIRASGNVSSITDNGTGNYTVNFTTAMPDANFCYTNSVGSGDHSSTSRSLSYIDSDITYLRILSEGSNGAQYNEPYICVVINI